MKQHPLSIVYITNIRLPTEKAHGLQIMKTCEALAGAAQSLRLMVPRRRNPIPDDPFDFYRVERNFAIERIWCIDFIAFPFLKAVGFLLESATFALAVVMYRRQSNGIYYTRDFLIAAIFLMF